MTTINNHVSQGDVVSTSLEAPEFAAKCGGISFYPALLYDMESHFFGWARKILISRTSGKSSTYVYWWADQPDHDHGVQVMSYPQATFLSGEPVAVVQAGRIASRTGYHAALSSLSTDFLYRRLRVLPCPQGHYLTKDQVAKLARSGEDYLSWKYASGFHTVWYFEKDKPWEPNWEIRNLPDGEPFHPTDDLVVTYLADTMGLPEWIQHSVPHRSLRGYRITPVGGGQYPPCKFWLRWYDKGRHTALAYFHDVWEIWRGDEQVTNNLPGVYLIELCSV